jgi:two-component system, response regulator
MTEDSAEILLVEDDPQDVELTMRALCGGNVKARIQVARDGEEALDYLFSRGPYVNRPAGHQPALVLLDLKLPKISGLQIIGQIKDDVHTRSIPVVVFTSSGEQKDILESYRMGANSFIQKPVESRVFRHTIRAVAYYWIGLNQRPQAKRQRISLPVDE